MGKIIILRGNCASDKSTTAIALQKKLRRGNLLIPQDTARREMLRVKDVPNNPSIELMKTLVKFGATNCDYTILEGVLYSDVNKSLFKYIVELFGKQIYAYYFDIPFNETLVRQKQRPTCNQWGETELRAYWREKDLLKFIPEKTIDSVAMNPDQIVQMILKDIGVSLC